MATGFQKFANKALQEGPISINTAPTEVTKETKEVKKFEQVSGIGKEGRGVVRRNEVVNETETAKVVDQPAAPAVEEKPEEKLFQITIKIKPGTKDKLDWLKFTQKKKFMELAEEAFEDIYKKYGGK